MSNIVHMVRDMISSQPSMNDTYIDAYNGRSSLMVCGLDVYNITTLDEDCTEIALILLGIGSNRTHVDYRNYTPLLMGAARGMTKYCELLITWGGFLMPTEDVNFVEDNGRTAAMLAAVNGHYNTLNMLLKYSVNTTMRTILHLATLRILKNYSSNAFDQYTSIINRTINDNIIDIGDIHNRTPLMYAAMGNNSDLVMLLLKYNANYSIKDIYNQTALSLSIAFPLISDILMNFSINDVIRRQSEWLGESAKEWL